MYPDVQLFIDGQWRTSEDGRTLAVINPATGETLGSVAHAGIADLDKALLAAERGFETWRSTPAYDRYKIMQKAANLLRERADSIASIMTQEQGKPLAEARMETLAAADIIDWLAEEGRRAYGRLVPSRNVSVEQKVIKEPVGPVAAFTPWNFPINQVVRKLSSALAAGCSIIVKAPEETPASPAELIRAFVDAGVPAGVIGLVYGDPAQISSYLIAHPTIKKVTFTGSTPVGKVLMEQCAGTVKKTSMELGGNAPFIVFDDADLDAAVAGALASKYRNAGQTCVCSNRILVQEGVYDAFAEKLAAAVNALHIGNGMEEGVTLGPLVNAGAARDVDSMVKDALDNGATAVTGGQLSSLGECFYEPTILTNVNDQMRVFREEIFGPVAPLFKFSTEEEAIQMANDTEFGLASYFYSRDIGRIWRVGEALEYGIVGINEGIISNEMAPFGGVKESGSGREGSKYGIDDYVEIKYLCMGGLDK